MKTESFEAADAPHVFVCMYQGSGNAMSVFARTTHGKAILPDVLRREVEAMDANLPVYGARAMEEVVGRSLARRRFALTLMGAFAVVALVLAALSMLRRDGVHRGAADRRSACESRSAPADATSSG